MVVVDDEKSEEVKVIIKDNRISNEEDKNLPNEVVNEKVVQQVNDTKQKETTVDLSLDLESKFDFGEVVKLINFCNA